VPNPATVTLGFFFGGNLSRDRWFADSPVEGNGFELPVRGEELAATLGKTANVFERLRGASPQERWIATTPRRRASRSRQALRVRVAAIGWR